MKVHHDLRYPQLDHQTCVIAKSHLTGDDYEWATLTDKYMTDREALSQAAVPFARAFQEEFLRALYFVRQ